MITIKYDDGQCECGCGRDVNRSFRQGHDAKLKSALLKAHRAGEPVTVNGKEQSAKAAARGYGFTITDGKVKKAAQPAPKPNGIAKVAAGDIAVGDLVAKARKGPFAQVAAIDDGPKARFLRDATGRTIARPRRTTEFYVKSA